SKTPKSLTPTNAPTISLKPLVPIIENQTSRPCATVSPWLVVSAATLSRALPTPTPAVKPARIKPAVDVKLLPRWDAGEENKPLNDGKILPRRTTKKRHVSP